MPEYIRLIKKLRELCDNKSELSGANPDIWSNYLAEPHHIRGRVGSLFLDPYNIILLTRFEHDIEEGKIRGEKIGKERLLQLVKALRDKQGFKEV